MSVVFFVLFPIVGWGEEQKTTTVITSNTMTASSEKNQAIFQGAVKMVQGELVVHSDVMIVYFKEKPPSGPPADPASKPNSESGRWWSSVRAEARYKAGRFPRKMYSRGPGRRWWLPAGHDDVVSGYAPRFSFPRVC
jgi:hypothetical protein